MKTRPNILEPEAPARPAPRPPNDRGQGRKPKTGDDATRMFGLRITHGLYDELAAEAERQGVAASDIVRNALQEALRKARRK